MKTTACFGLALFCLPFSFASSTRAEACKSVEIGGVGYVDVCLSEKGLASSQVASSTRLISCPPAWELDLRPSAGFSRIRLRVHSAGPYYVKNRLIMRACALEPAFLGFGEREWSIDRGRCTQWLDLGEMEYAGPRDCYSATTQSAD